eukprot:TRINITY_DN62072_c0_g1_i1.p1 TRINITY_DN62072_c0_g1~~TRINITY_DN62072_c0_g1_i1.p1  ORF type:complete len:228 (-),score=23.35 TRINITY_DN62072_c0_g1_i1:106-789(-)
MPSKNIVVTGLSGETLYSDSEELGLTLRQFKEKLEKQIEWPATAQMLLLAGAPMKPLSATLGSIFGDCADDPLNITFVKLFGEEVYFFGLSWGRSGCGISARHCRGVGDALNNQCTQDRFKKLHCDDGVCFESVSHPGLFMGAKDGVLQNQKIVLTEADGNKEVFKQIAAINGDPNKITLESVAFPGRYICHFNGTLYCHSRESKLAGDAHYIHDASWNIAEAESED